AMADLKSALEAPSMATPKHVFEVYIRTSPERLWQALTDGDLTQRYYHDTRVASGWKVGDAITYTWTDGTVTIDGQIVEADAPRRLVHTFHFTQDPEQAAERPSRCTWEIEPMGEACLLRLIHDGFDGETSTYRSVGNVKGWSFILSGLKTVLETGESLHIAETAEATAGRKD
ncbi:MAG TPA: SRPBCC family protein, partial [Candidatus Limnocylindria bacterium]|nr:SRPBCC family protein [Candidatus Limnocylindria bacterium]